MPGMIPLSRLCRPAGEEHAEAMTVSDHPAWSSPRQDSMKTQSKPFFVLPEAGKNLHFPGGDIASIMLSGEQTGGTLTVVAGTQAPDSCPPLHIHRNEDEFFLLLEGRYSFFAEARWIEVGAGGVVYLPKGIAHCYRNIGTTTGRHWIITTPSG
jgi:mannose-6-phosphate isomerase-like protein (cupin superfamily)